MINFLFVLLIIGIAASVYYSRSGTSADDLARKRTFKIRETSANLFILAAVTGLMCRNIYNYFYDDQKTSMILLVGSIVVVSISIPTLILNQYALNKIIDLDVEAMTKDNEESTP